MREAVIVDAIHSPMTRRKPPRDGHPGGALCEAHPIELLGQTPRGLLDRNQVDPAGVDDVITGCVSHVGERAGSIGRWTWLGQGPEPQTCVWAS
jgi:acetyl-CoA acyltransferase